MERSCIYAAYSRDLCFNTATGHVEEGFADFGKICEKLSSTLPSEFDKQRLNLLIRFTIELKGCQFDRALCLSISSMLIRLGILSGISVFDLMQGFRIGLGEIINGLFYNSTSDCCCMTFVDLSDEDDVRKIIRSTLYHRSRVVPSGMLLAHSEESMITPIYNAFRSNYLEACTFNEESSIYGAIVYHYVLGSATESMVCLERCAVMDLPFGSLSAAVDTATKREYSYGLIVAVFECSLETLSPHFHSSSSTSYISNCDDVLQFERNWLHYVAEALSGSAVSCVICQKKIHPYLIRLLKSKNITSLERVSKRHIGCLLRLTGACLLGEGLLRSWGRGSSGGDGDDASASASGGTRNDNGAKMMTIPANLLGYLKSLTKQR